MRNKTTGHHLCQGGPSSKTAPAVVAPEQRTGIQTGKPRSHCSWPIHDPKDHRAEYPADAVAHDCLLRLWSPDRNSSTPVQSLNGQPQSTARRSWTLLKIYGRHVGILAANMNSQSCWELPTPVSRPETSHQQLEQIWSDLATHSHPIAPQEATKTLAWSSVANIRWNEPIHPTCDTHSRLLFDSGQNYSQLKQNTCHRGSKNDHHPHYAMLTGPLQKTEHGTNVEWYECAPINWRT